MPSAYSPLLGNSEEYPKKSKSRKFRAVRLLVVFVFILGALVGLKMYNDRKEAEQVPLENVTASLRFESWNIRQDAMPNGDSIEDTIGRLNESIPTDNEVQWYGEFKEVPWSQRRIGMSNEVRFNDPDLFSVNEALHRQVYDLEALLSPMKWVGVGRDDGKESGEYQAIYYNPAVADLLEWDTFWLSKTPFVPSKFPGAGSTRSATVGHFRHIETGFDFVLINMHLDDQSDEQRRLGAALAKYRAAYEFDKNECPVFLVGDFNSQSAANEGSSGAYRIATGKEAFNNTNLDAQFVKKFASQYSETFVFDDMFETCPPERRMGHLATFTGFSPAGKDYSRIDFQFGGNPHSEGIDKLWHTDGYKVGENWFDYSYYLSDHRPVVSDVTIWN